MSKEIKKSNVYNLVRKIIRQHPRKVNGRMIELQIHEFVVDWQWSNGRVGDLKLQGGIGAKAVWIQVQATKSRCGIGNGAVHVLIGTLLPDGTFKPI